MRNLLGRYVNRYEKKHRDFRHYAMIVAVLALVVFVGVNWRLHDKGISMTSDYQCGLKEHKHTADCYKKVLICGKEETDGSEGHTHTDACYKEEKKLTCDKEEHKHNADCYDEEGNLICDKEEHTHSEDCYTTEKKQICGKEESKPVKAHHHTDACYKKELVCKLKEHTHTASCYSNENADVEDKSDWEATIPTLSGNWAEDIVSVAESQIGYEESTANFKLADDGETRKGYTRYGDWYGNKYGDWSAMFASFCLNYAGISSKTVPVNSGSTAWITELKQKDLYKTADNHNPTTGDLVFLDTDSDGKADHVGIITGTETKDDVEDSKVTSLTAIVGDSNDAVEENTYEISGDTIVGYCALPENPDAKDAEATTEEATKAGKDTEKKKEESTKAEGTTAKTAESKKKTSNKAKKSESKKDSTDVSEQAAQKSDSNPIFDALTSKDDDSAVFFIQKIDENYAAAIAEQDADQGIATQAANNTIDFGKYITGASLKKLINETWTDATEFNDGDQVKVKLEYEITEENIVTADNPTITYQLSDGIKLSSDESGIVSGTINGTYYANLGNYTITKDGLISITFNDTFLATNQKFSGHIEFTGTASNSSTSDSKDIIFGADGTHYTVKPKPVNEDLTVKKTASEAKDGKISYTITATSENGTGSSNIKISDSLRYSGLDGDKVKIGTITVKDKNGNNVSYNQTNSSGDGYKNFDITDLPPLGPGETYTITYDVDYGEPIGNGFSSLDNTVTCYKGNDWKSQDHVYTEISKKMISKSGWATDSNTKVQWKIEVNPEGLTGVAGEYTLSDLLKKDGQNTDFNLADDAEELTIVEINRNNGWQRTTYKKDREENDNSSKPLEDIFKDGKLTVKDGCSYEITYKTPVDKADAGTQFKYNNEATISKGDKDYSDGSGDIGVTVPSFIKKESKGTEEGSNDTAIAKWKATLNLQYFNGDTITYKDTLLDASGNKNANVHYTTVKQLKESLALSCEVTNDNKEKVISDSEYTLKCYNEKDELVTEDEDTVVWFEIELAKPENGKNLFITYSTTMNTKGLGEDKTLVVKNKGEFNGKEVNSSNSYTKVKRLYKYGGKMDSNGNISYGPGDATVDYEAQDGKLYYRIIVKPKDSKTFTITDTLPEGVTLDPDDVNIRIYENQWNIYDEKWYDGIEYVKKEKESNPKAVLYNPEISVNGQELKITFSNEDLLAQLAKNTHGFCIDYKVTLSESFWKDLKNNKNQYANTVQWNAKTETQKTTVTRQTDVIGKTAEQVVGADGKVKNTVKYYVTINPAGEKLNEGRNLTLTDTLQTQNITSEIRLGTVKLYSYNQNNKNDHYKGEELNATSFTFQYDESKKTFTAVVPDQTPCVLEYEYDIDLGDKNSVTVNNSVKLTGQDSTSSNNSISIKASNSSAGVTKGNILELIKVDSQHYQITLKGAEFRINYYENSTWTQGSDTYTTGEDGSVNVESSGVKKNTLCAVEETKAPENYNKADKQYYFVWLENKTADEWWNSNGSNLKDKAGNAIDRSDIYFITKDVGTMMIPNQYSKLVVTKLWRDSDGNPTTNAGAKEIKVKLKKATQRPASGYNVTINYYYLDDNNEKIKSNYSGTYVVKKNGKVTITMKGGWNNDNIVSVPDGWTYEDNNNPVIVKSNEITQDNQVFEIVGNRWRRYEDVNNGNSFTVETTSPGYDLETSDYEEVTLSKDNNWTYSWDNLPTKDEDGNDLYYVVEEVDVPSGYIVSYTGNDGIQSGQITIINKKDKDSYTLPETGGSGTLPFITVGASLMGFALLCGYSMRRRRGRRVE